MLFAAFPVSILACILLTISRAQSTTNSSFINMTSAWHHCYDTQCQNKMIECNFPYGTCQIECHDPFSCENATMRLGALVDGTASVNVYCRANQSCRNAEISDLSYLYALGENTMSGSYVECIEDGRGCTVLCKNSLSCSNTEIVGTNAGSLSIECDKFQSCLDLTIHCPPGARNGANCQIKGDKQNQIDIHNQFTIYAPNGWNDIEFIDYRAYTLSGQLYCGGNDSFMIDGGPYSCDIEYGVWDCTNTSSPCRNQDWLNLNRETFLCDGETTSMCEDTVIECTANSDEGYQYAVPSCTVLCSADQSCADLTVVCHAEKECNVVCSGDESCRGLTVFVGTQSTGYFLVEMAINIICGRDGNHAACQGGNFSVPTRTNYLFEYNVYALGTDNLLNAQIYSTSSYSGQLSVQCNYNRSCQGMTVSTNQRFTELAIQCNGEYDACADLTVYCPRSGSCEIRGESIDTHNHLQLYCEASWDDIDVSQWTNVQVLGDANLMHCGYDLQHSCVLDNWFNCSCPPATTISPTMEPTVMMQSTLIPTVELSTTTPAPTIADTEDDWFIVAISFIVLFFVATAALAYFAWLFHKADDKATQDDFERIRSQEEDVEVTRLNRS